MLGGQFDYNQMDNRTNQNSFILNLPKRPQLSQARSLIKAEQILTNYFSFSNLTSNLIYQYDITFDPPLPQDSRAIFKGCIASTTKQLSKRLNFFVHRGKTIYTFANLIGVNSFECNYLHKNQEVKQDVIFKNVLHLKKTKQIDLRLIYNDKKSWMKIFHFFNCELKRQLQETGLIELEKGRFFQKINLAETKNFPFNVYRGFNTSIHMINQQLKLLVDVSTRIIRKQNLFDILMSCSVDQKNQLIGRSVFASYGTQRIFKIKKFDTQITASCTFCRDGKNISYLNYFKESYGVNLKHKDQKMIISSIKKKQTLQGKIIEKQIDIYLPPEVLYLTGLNDHEKNDFNLMKQLGKYSKLTPEQRVYQTKMLLKSIKSTSKIFSIEDDPNRVQGHILTQPTFIYGNDIKITSTNGIVNSRAKVFQPMNLKNWVIIYSQTCDVDRENCDLFIDTLMKASIAYGIKISEPQYIIVQNGKQSTFISKLQSYVKTNLKPQFVVSILKPKQNKYYSSLKQLLLNKLAIPHQAVITKTFNNQKRCLSVCSKILLQMNAKLGFPLWKIQDSLPSLKNKKIIIGGMAIYHKLLKNNLSCCALAGTINDDKNSYYQDTRLIPQNQQRFDCLYQMTQQWVKRYCMSTKSTPDVIVIYRDGVGESQIKSILSLEVQVIQKTIETIKLRMKKPDYNPGIIFILTNKKINQRLFNNRNGKINNPPSGTVVGKSISRYQFDFYMSPHYANQGTCTPTQFNVIYNTSNLSEDQIWRLTFDSCFGYFNWSGAVRVPAPLQYANKLAHLIGDTIKQSPTDKDLKSKLYCL